MGFRLGFGGGCAPCCGGPPPSDACLGSCRPAGETRPISSVNVTLKAADYTVSFPFIGPSGIQTFYYKWPGSTYNGTFSLTPTANGFEYNFPACGGCTPYIRYITQGTNHCRLFFNLPALVGYAAPSCSSLAVFTSIPAISVDSCVTPIAGIPNAGDSAAMTLDTISYFWYFAGASLKTQLTNFFNDQNNISNYVIFETCSGTGGNYAGIPSMHMAAGITGGVSYMPMANPTYAGSPALQFDPLSVTYG